MNRRLLNMASLLLLGSIPVAAVGVAQQTRAWGDQHNGTYANPILPGDFQNTDVIRVGHTYYYISATKELSPGMLIMSSKDLVNWKYLGHAVTDITQLSANYNYDKMLGASRGIWAGAIRYHRKKFYLYFTDPDVGLFVTTASHAEGPWAPLTLMLKAPGWDDPCPLWDDDGRGYLVMTSFSGNYTIHLFQLSKDGLQLNLPSDSVIHQSRGSEANKLYKINGWYYHFYSEVTTGGRMPFITRSKNIYGPYTGRRQLIHPAEGEPNQGGMLQTQKGNWYFVTHHGKAYWAGREVSLLPVTWVDGWPIWGDVGTDGIGNMVWQGKKPVAGIAIKPMQTSDEFNGARLSAQWEWYFQPHADRWSITERPGFLRLYACRALQPATIPKLPNVLTQRPLRVAENNATLKLDIAHMADGQSAGLSMFGKTFAATGVKQADGVKQFYYNENGKLMDGPVLAAGMVDLWLRATWNAAGKTSFFFSTDGMHFTGIGNAYQATNFGNFLGAKIALFTCNDKEEKGFVDVDWFHYVAN